ncbi:hypothetical protein ICW40_10030 [Actinotalea ferrariae]|uniref:hypothetical protein n=1 Tax=Actinotalea ferrariae TaxID=1386098 RepID=UPI001EB37F9B|nr:hypothetical protein [Actinotalea ferrariae]MBX9245143.1 hypothetical protein [Actinotalea ferrariae]
MRTTRALWGVALVSLALGACTASPPDGESTTPTPTPTPEVAQVPELRLPEEPTTVLDAADAAARAASLSEALFASAPVAVIAPADDVAAQVDAAAMAVSLGAPLLLTGTAGGTSPDAATDVTAAELERLNVVAVLAVGEAEDDVDLDVPVTAAPDDAQDRAAVLRVDPLPTPSTAPGAEVATVAALAAGAHDPGAEPSGGSGGEPSEAPSDEPSGEPSEEASDEPSGSSPSPSSSRSTGTSAGSSPSASSEDGEDRLPLTERAETPSGGLVLTTGDPVDVAAVATARAAGVPVLVVPGGDPRVGSATVQAVAAAAPTAVVGLGAAFGPPETLTWKVATAATGVELPGGGQTLFPGRRLVALYGTPTFPALGLLGEQDLPSSIARAQGLAAEYQALTADVVVPAFEIIVTIASAGAGPDGNYSNELPVETFVPWVEAARDAGVYVVLDLQPGRTDFLTQARLYEPLLLYPNVGLALDPEWRLAPDQVHLRQIGSVHASEVNAVSTYLADLTRAHALPQKLFVLHQFSHRMIADRALVDTSRPELATMIHVDGQGSQGAKAGTWASLQQGAPAGLTWGWKNFVDEDVPMLTPPETYAVQPVPELVTYQ